MSTKTETSECRVQPKRGTIGYSIKQLVKRYGNSLQGHYILTEALKQSCEMRSYDLVKIEGLLVSETPGGKRVNAEEKAAVDKIRNTLVIL